MSGLESAGLLAGTPLAWPCGSWPKKLGHLVPPEGAGCFSCALVKSNLFQQIKSFQVMMGVKGEALDSLFLSSPSSASLLGSGGMGELQYPEKHLCSLQPPHTHHTCYTHHTYHTQTTTTRTHITHATHTQSHIYHTHIHTIHTHTHTHIL